MHTRTLAAFAAGIALTVSVAGCTSDYGRITDKIAAYEVQVNTARVELGTAKTQAQRIHRYNEMISLTRKQLEIARRINPESNPAYRSGSMTLEQARADKAARVSKLESQLVTLAAERDAEVAKPVK